MNVINLGDLSDGAKAKDSNSANLREAVGGGPHLSAKEKLILQIMEEMEVDRDVAVEIVGGEEEEDEENEVIQVVLIPSTSDNKTLFTAISEDTTIEPLETKLRSIMDGQLNTTRLVAERGKAVRCMACNLRTRIES